MATIDASVADEGPNDPRAVRMAVIGFLTFNVVIGSIFGTPGVLLKPMAERLGTTSEQTALGPLLVILSSAIFAPMIGSLATRISLRTLLAAAALMLAAAWGLLAMTTSFAGYAFAYFVLMGPTLSIGASIVPPTLVTRWFSRHRGMAIGLVHLPVLVAALPMAGAWVITHYGLTQLFTALALVPLVVLLPAAWFLIDRPPGQQEQVNAMIASGERHAMTIWQLLKQPRYWALCMAVGVANTSSTMLGVHLVSMAESWGIPNMSAAGLASIMSGVGLAGSIVFGIVADRIGGAKAIALIAAGDTILWSLLLVGLPYAGLAVVIGLIGLFGAGAVPGLTKALADNFGRESFSRANGLMVAVTLPLLIVGMIGPGTVVRVTGNYTMVVWAAIAAFAVATLLALSVSGKPRAVSTPAG